ncbi:MAG: hypothetical protein HYX27_16180 [Acidobacteria bacterium]|nr:hypothetical protein [Acidobacteriota bacterium]
MTRGAPLIAAFLLIATLLYPQGKKSKKVKGLEATIEKIEVRRDGDVVLLDGTVKNTGMKPIHGMTLHFEFFAPNKESLTIQNGPIESAFLEPGAEAEFRLQVKYPTRAVELKIEARDKDQRDLELEKNGPYRIE